MFIKDWKREVFTIPNFLSFIRLLLIPVYTIIYLNAKQFQDFSLAAGILAISCLTDMIDGKIARQFDMISNIGKILDPLADKLTQLSLSVCLSIRYPVVRGVLIIFVIKEVFQTAAAYVMFRKGKVLPGALMAGKICTTVLFVSFICLMLIPTMPLRIVTAISIVDTVLLANALIHYFLANFGKHPKLQNLE